MGVWQAWVAVVLAAHVVAPSPNTRVLVADHAPTVLQHGDAAPLEALYIVYNRPWRDALVPLLREAAPRVRVVARPNQVDDAARWLQSTGVAAELVSMPIDSPWIRDYGPLQRAGVWVDARYHESRPHDDAVPQLLGAALKRPVEAAPFFLEGGGIISNGVGLCAMTWSSFMAMRLPLEDGRWEDALHVLGCAALAVVPQPTMERTGHIDMLAQFTARDRVVMSAGCPHVDVDDAASLDEGAQAFTAAAELLQQPLAVSRVPMHVDAQGTFYSYVNAVRVNGLWWVPLYGAVPATEEESAYRAMAQAAPNATLVPLSADPFNALGGALHCITWGLAEAPIRP